VSNNVLIDTDGTWSGTSLLNNNLPLEALRVRVRLQVHRQNDITGKARIAAVDCQHFALLPDGTEVGILPGAVEVSVNGKGFTIGNNSLLAQEVGGGVEVYTDQETDYFGDVISETQTVVETPGEEVVGLDPNGYFITWQNSTGDLLDPIAHWRNELGYWDENLIGIIDGAVIDFNYPEDHWYIAISLYKDNRFRADEVLPIILGASPSHATYNPFA
jgi:hypothetical protein